MAQLENALPAGAPRQSSGSAASSLPVPPQVDKKGTMLNLYLDGAGDMQYVPVGNIADLRKLDVKAIGGVPVEVQALAHLRLLRALRPRHALAADVTCAADLKPLWRDSDHCRGALK